MNIFKKETSYSKQKIKNNLLKQWGFVLCCVVYVVFFVYMSKNIKIVNDENSFLIIFSMILGLFLGVFFVWVNNIVNNFFKKTDSEINKAKKGDKGEVDVYMKLIKILGNDYKIYKNFQIKNTRFDFDFLIVGPKGLIAVEVKNSSYNYIFTEEKAIKSKILKYSKTETTLYGKSDPRKKLINRCNYLKHLITTSETENIAIRKLLIFIDSDVEIIGKPKVFIVKNINNLSSYFNTLKEDVRFTRVFCELINKKLESLR